MQVVFVQQCIFAENETLPVALPGRSCIILYMGSTQRGGKMLDDDDTEEAWQITCTLKDALAALQNARSAIFMVVEGIEIESIA